MRGKPGTHGPRIDMADGRRTDFGEAFGVSSPYSKRGTTPGSAPERRYRGSDSDPLGAPRESGSMNSTPSPAHASEEVMMERLSWVEQGDGRGGAGARQ